MEFLRIVPFIVVLTVLTLLFMLRSRQTGATAWIKVGDALCAAFVATACIIMAFFVGLESAVRMFFTASRAEYRARWQCIASATGAAFAVRGEHA